MNPRTQNLHDPVQIKPLLRSIAHEITERSAAVQALEARVDAIVESPRGRRDELLDLRAELAEHRHEIRLARKELEHLGWSFEEGESPMLVMSTGGGIERLAWQPEQTGFHPRTNGAGL
jgi:hypothetical protein